MKKFKYLTRTELIKNIRQRLKDEYEIEVDKEVVSAVLNIEEDEVYMAVARNLAIKYLWGIIYGTEAPPRRLAGSVLRNKSVLDNNKYSHWKVGVPKIKWSKAMLECEERDAGEYFELKEHRYTSAARMYRKAFGLPEIPEYDGLSDEKITELCKKADEIEFNSLTRGEQTRKKADMAHDDRRNRGNRLVWEHDGYIPFGADAERLPWDGPNRDAVDGYIRNRLAEDWDDVMMLEKIRRARDFAAYYGPKMVEKHKDQIDKLEAEYVQKVKEQGLQEIEHEFVDFDFIKKKRRLQTAGDIETAGDVDYNDMGLTYEQHISNKINDYNELVRELAQMRVDQLEKNEK